MISPEILRRYPYFSGIDEESLKAIAMFSEEREVAAGQTLFGEGETAGHLFIVAGGEVDIQCVFETGERKTVDTLVPGELLVWSAIVEPYKTTASGVAKKDTKLVAIEAGKLRELCEKDHTLGYQLMTEVAKAVSNRLDGARVQLAAVS